MRTLHASLLKYLRSYFQIDVQKRTVNCGFMALSYSLSEPKERVCLHLLCALFKYKLLQETIEFKIEYK